MSSTPDKIGKIWYSFFDHFLEGHLWIYGHFNFGLLDSIFSSNDRIDVLPA